MTYLQEQPGFFPTIDLGCGTWCSFEYTMLASTAIAIVVTILLGVLVARSLTASGSPSKFQMVFELIYGYVRGLVREQGAEDAAGFIVPLAMTVFVYILVANWLDFFPISLIPVGSGTLEPANANLNQTLAMALVVVILAQAYSIRTLGLKGYLLRFTRAPGLPGWARIPFTLLNIVEELAKPVSLSLRLFGNLFAGVLMVYLISILLGALPLHVGTFVVAPVFTAIWKLFDVLFIGGLQAFIFMLLTCMYFGQAREGVEGHH